MQRIVVGVDDSPGARAALTWALEEARLRGARLEVVHAWTLPWAEGFNREVAADATWYRESSMALLESIIEEAEATVAAAGGPPVAPVPTPVQCEGPAFGLLAQAEGADLLVVGSRGRGGFAGLLLGSVSTQCVHHAHCPVTVVPAPTK